MLMTTTVQKACDGNKPLDYLQAVIQQEEGIFGPLQSLAAQAPNNVITMIVGPSPPSSQRAVLATYDGHPPEKPGATLICVADCLVDGNTAKVAAYRPNAT
jgi:hypothetical protein